MSEKGRITYQIWGRVQRLGPMEFGAIVTAMPDDDSIPQVELKTFGTSQEVELPRLRGRVGAWISSGFKHYAWLLSER